ncbi:hypothetical protein [Brachyspira alvinipulli]|uniref:hypothetical protein n=1 Tax=Brachyspira alvinipulli TaxID=84379 RepID=UPI000480237A|nr:hypothetical protein [Brachyspira alvinipulli]
MKRVVLIALSFLLILSNFIYAVDKKYIPSNVDSVISFNANTLAEKAEVNLQKVLNNFFMQGYADKYLEYRNDPFVAEVMTNRLNDYIDFSKTSRIVFFNGYQQMSIILDVKNITELDKLMIKMASQEDKLVSVSDKAVYKYLALDDYNLISWNNDIFTITVKLKDTYWYDEELDKEYITSVANYIFLNNTPLEDEKFISLEKENNDCHIWDNLSLLSDDNSDFAKFLLGRSYNSISRDGYKDAILTAKINFNKGNADVVIDTYTPNYPYDTSLLKKQLADNIYSFVNGENNYGFFSLAFNSKELSNYLKNVMGDINNLPIVEEFYELEEYGIDIYKFIELLAGDIFVSVWDMPSSDVDQTPAVFFSASITDNDAVKTILEALAEDSTNDIYTIGGYFCLIKDSIFYMSNNDEVVNSIVNGEPPAKSLGNDKANIAKQNEMALYFEFSQDLDLYGIDEYSESLESVYLTSNILANNHTQVVFKVNTRDKQKNALTVIKSFINLE